MWVYRHISPEVCPENERFAEVAAERDYAARPARIAENSGQAAASALMLGGDGDGDGGEDVSAETWDGGDGAGAVPSAARVPTTDGLALVDLMRMSEDDRDAFARGSALRRAGYAGLRRNVAIAPGSWLAGPEVPGPDAVGELVAELSDEDYGGGRGGGVGAGTGAVASAPLSVRAVAPATARPQPARLAWE
jgi:hypothetical protein